MPASSPAEAVELYRSRRVALLSCLTPAYVELRGYAPSPAPHPFALAKGETVRLRGESQLGERWLGNCGMRFDRTSMASESHRMVSSMTSGTPTIESSAPPTTTTSMRRRNRAESLVRDRLASIEDAYVFRSSWHRNGAGPEPLVAVIARDDEARRRAQEALADIAGFPAEQWQTSWTPLDLGDWMVWVYPERPAA